MISISVTAALEGNGVSGHIVSDHPLNHLFHPETAAGPYGLQVDVGTIGGLAPIAAGLADLGEALSSIAPAFLHVGFNNDPFPDGVTLQGTEINMPRLGIGQEVPVVADSTIVAIRDLLN